MTSGRENKVEDQDAWNEETLENPLPVGPNWQQPKDLDDDQAERIGTLANSPLIKLPNEAISNGNPYLFKLFNEGKDSLGDEKEVAFVIVEKMSSK